MPKLDFLDFHTKFIAFEKMVRANRTRCDTRFAEVVHDRLADALQRLAGFCREGNQAETMLRTETDPTAREALEEIINFCVGDLETSGGGFYPWHLLDCIDPEMDWGGYRDPVAEMWCPHPIPKRFTVADEHLHGLSEIIARIAAETGIRFTTYLYYDCIGPEGAKSLDPEIYEKPIGNHRYG
ncbi:hypothetical protein [Neoaquamicrobium sediminum]|uniref:hypothetical protein n=1 Tax=Neoaquamicrobium sediminum TaxID=1849104 RepID=UPI0015672779|nr:hypothetical protein [Mesorhizobium sediminum]NRC52920.1 hypothetical protein [Mesorhizobium sediminum]